MKNNQILSTIVVVLLAVAIILHLQRRNAIEEIKLLFAKKQVEVEAPPPAAPAQEMAPPAAPAQEMAPPPAAPVIAQEMAAPMPSDKKIEQFRHYY